MGQDKWNDERVKEASERTQKTISRLEQGFENKDSWESLEHDFYYQSKSEYVMSKRAYMSAIRQIQMYHEILVKIKRALRKQQEGLATLEDINTIVTGESILNTIEYAGKSVPEEYRQAVFERLVNRASFEYLEYEYHVSRSTVRRYSQIFCYFFLKEKGELFEDNYSLYKDEEKEDKICK